MLFGWDLRRQNQPDNVRLPLGNASEEKSYWSAQLSTFYREKPFGKNVEGLFHCGDESCAVEDPVQRVDTFARVFFSVLSQFLAP